MIDFISKGYLELSGVRVERDLQNEKFLLSVGFEPKTFRLRSKGATTELPRTDVCGEDSSSAGFNCAIHRNLPAAHCRYSKVMCHVFL